MVSKYITLQLYLKYPLEYQKWEQGKKISVTGDVQMYWKLIGRKMARGDSGPPFAIARNGSRNLKRLWYRSLRGSYKGAALSWRNNLMVKKRMNTVAGKPLSIRLPSTEEYLEILIDYRFHEWRWYRTGPLIWEKLSRHRLSLRFIDSGVRIIVWNERQKGNIAQMASRTTNQLLFDRPATISLRYLTLEGVLQH